MQALALVFVLTLILALLSLLVHARRSGKAIFLAGFHEERSVDEVFPSDEWELPRQGRGSAKRYRNRNGTLLIPFPRDTGNMAIDFPSYLLYFKGLAFHSHYMSLMDDMDVQYGSRFKPRGKKFPDNDLNIYIFNGEQQLGEFSEFVALHRKTASIEMNQGAILVVVNTGDLQKGLDIIDSAKARFGSE